jgi:exosome complex RNA-binding protein Rrp42 (RNase PH superfamily)
MSGDDLFIIASSGGSLLDACSHVIHAALLNTQLPCVWSLPKESGDKPALQVEADATKARNIPGVDKAPVIVTVTVLKCPAFALDQNTDKAKKPTTTLILDATVEEEACAFAQVHVAVDQSSEEPTICSLHKAGTGSLPFGLLQDITAFALQATKSTNFVSAQNQHHMLQEHFIIQQ